MKKVLFTIAAGAALILAGCNKEADNAPEQKIGKTYTIKATVENPATRSVASLNTTTDKYEFAWEAGELIGVLPDGDPTVLQFQLAEGSDDTFTYVAEPGAPEYTSFGLAVTPMDALSPAEGSDFSYVDGSDVNYYVNLSGSYTQGQSNAVMVASSPETQGDGTQKFSFKHLAALVRVTYENIPEGVLFMEFTTPDHPITGTFHFTTVEGAQIVAGDFPAGESDPMGEAWVILPEYTGTIASADFYLPIPTGNYRTFNVQLYDENMDPVPGSQKTFSTSSSPFTVSRADVVECPTITLDAPETLAGEWIMVGEKEGDYFAAQAFESGNNNLKGTSVTVSGNAVTSATYIPVKMTFTYVSEGTYAGMYTIQDANGYYLYAASSSDNYLKANESITETNQQHYYWTITEESNGVYSIVASKSGNRNVLRFNYNGGNNSLFSCYASTSTTGTNVQLYKWADANIPNPTCATPEISCQNNVITITTATAGATIYYVIGADATVADPTTASSVYDPANKPTISDDGYVKAIAVAEGYVNSAVAGAAVTYSEGEVWTLVENVNELEDGMQIVITNANHDRAISTTQNNNNRAAEEVTEENNELTINENVQLITLEASGNNWKLKVGDNLYLYAASNSSNHLKTASSTTAGNNGVFSIAITNNVASVIAQGSNARKDMRYNSSNNFFSCYATTTSESKIAIFKKTINDGKQNAGITFTPASATITWGDTFTQPTLNNAHGLTVTYASSDPAVASLNGSTIVVNKAGTATITASWTEQTIGGVTYRAGSTDFALTVNKATPVVAFNNPTTTVNVGGFPVTNVATITPNTLAVTYSSSDNNVATVTAAGVVTGIAEGTATITAAFAGNDNYEAASGSYEMTVVDNRTFAVTITQPQTGGTFKVNVDGSEIATGASVQVNKTVTLTAVPATGYTLISWSVTKTDDPTTVVAVNNGSFTMPAYAVTITASFAQGYPAVAHQEIVFSDIFSDKDKPTTIPGTTNYSIKVDKGEGSNAPQYYNTGTALRLYAKNTMTVTVDAGYKITTIEFTFASGGNSNEITASIGTFTNGVWSGSIQNGESVTFTVGGTTGHRRISKVTVD